MNRDANSRAKEGYSDLTKRASPLLGSWCSSGGKGVGIKQKKEKGKREPARAPQDEEDLCVGPIKNKDVCKREVRFAKKQREGKTQ